MTKESAKNLGQEEWYQALVEECRAIIVETVFTSRIELIKGKWLLGDRLWQEKNKGITKLLTRVSVDLRISERECWRCYKFREEYQDFLNKSGEINIEVLPGGKNISWHKIANKYLPRPKEKEKIELPEGKYTVVYADPPWQYEFSETETRAIESHYPTLSLKEIKEIKVPAEDNSVLFLWTPAPKLKEALEVMENWGFKYRTHCVWDKEIIGTGYWFRQQHELLLVGVRGQFPPPLPELRESSVYREKRTEHSRKPDHYYEFIEKTYSNQKYIELFARRKRAGWESWGDELCF